MNEKIRWDDLVASRPAAIQHLVASLSQDSYAVISCSDADAVVFSQALGLGREFFRQNIEYKSSCYETEPVITGFAGYNRPSKAKEVFRVRHGRMQPWPLSSEDFDRATEFRESLIRVQTLLHRLVFAVSALALEWTTSSDDAHAETIALLKECLDPNEGLADTENESRVGLVGEELSMPPLDLFHYYNSEESGRSSNCHPHLDPGLITAVVAAEVPGLSIMEPIDDCSDDEDGQWLAVEKLLKPTHDVIVFVGESLQLLSGGIFPAAYHRVDGATAPRISLVYDLQPRIAYPAQLTALFNAMVASAQRLEAQPLLGVIHGWASRGLLARAEPPLKRRRGVQR
jgi:isopenicillin N synthase-like dioxygenase